MKVRAETFWVQKRGNHEREYEDAYAPKSPIEFTCASLGKATPQFAIADGSSEGFFSKKWANILVDNFKIERKFKSSKRFIDSLNPAYSEWRIWKKNHLLDRSKNQPIKWFEEPGIEKGAFSSLLGVVIRTNDLQAVAVGDSCLFLIRDGRCEFKFPLDSSESFNNRPYLLSSENVPQPSFIERASFTFKDDDCIYMMTDALAAWFLKALEEDINPIITIDSITSQDQFADFVKTCRDETSLRNDDTTLMIIRRTR
jgi:serine/threonine protein phosphatase PrpC